MIKPKIELIMYMTDTIVLVYNNMADTYCFFHLGLRKSTEDFYDLDTIHVELKNFWWYTATMQELSCMENICTSN